MGVAYNVIPVAVVDRYPFAVECLRHYDMISPTLSKPGRNPTPQELRTILDELAGYTTDYLVSPGNWQASVEATTGLRPFRSSTLVNVIDFSGDETIPYVFYFEKGDVKLNILIVERLSRLCGPFYIFPDTGARPLLVTPSLDPAEAVKSWNP